MNSKTLNRSDILSARHERLAVISDRHQGEQLCCHRKSRHLVVTPLLRSSAEGDEGAIHFRTEDRIKRFGHLYVIQVYYLYYKPDRYTP